MDDLTLAVFELARAQLSAAGGELPGPDAGLREAGLGSLETVRLMLAVEARFGVQFPADLLRPEVFSTPRTLARAVRSLLGARD
ncbi:phosphopantetheine-binding protein [Longimicrobium sp.]|uniref:phosphopantetheine-binding protein n=1 Tax=Longimicrobium sp. TaxID=2029185 RepID=UPI002C4D1522|nr:phosphopantetheine-binding protein [Longimicrobium sp.]HSU16585.1 phosphopantetheine-binding protein [Longimicrobium sp.]